MKFISKSSNLLVVLRPGMSAQPLTGTPAKPTVSVRFKDGIAIVEQEELVDLMLVHPGFNADYISADEIASDPYAAARKPSEPVHVLTEMKFGTPQNRQVKGNTVQIPAEMQPIISSLAAEMAKAMLPDLLKSVLSSYEKEKEVNVAPGKAKGRPKGKTVKKSKKMDASEEESETENPLTEESVS